MAFSKYNKDRPFLIVDLIRSVPKNSPTHRRNYGKDGEWQLGEHISIEDCVKNKHLTQAAIIVDILKAKLVKNRTERPDQEVLQYLISKYKTEITEGIQLWMRKNGMSITPQQIQKIENNIDKQDIIALTLEEGASPNVSDMIDTSASS